MKKHIAIVVFFVFVSSLLCAGDKFFISAGAAGAWPLDSGFREYYGSVQFSPELKAGFKAGTHGDLNRKILNAFIEKPSVAFLAAGEETADCYARIWSALRQAGRPIPTNDVWIAAQAMETGSVLITFDAHFAHVSGLRIWEA